MGVKLSALKIDPRKRDEGVWFEYELGIRLKVARFGNPAFVSAYAAIPQANRSLRFNAATMGVEEFRALDMEGRQAFARAIATHLLKDIDGAVNEDGTPLVYTPELGFAILMDPGHQEFVGHVIKMANTAEAFRVDDVNIALGNSSAASNGNSSGENSRQPSSTA